MSTTLLRPLATNRRFVVCAHGESGLLEATDGCRRLAGSVGPLGPATGDDNEHAVSIIENDAAAPRMANLVNFIMATRAFRPNLGSNQKRETGLEPATLSLGS